MDSNEDLELDEIDFASLEGVGERLPLLTLDEAHNLLDWLRDVVTDGGPHAPAAGRWVKELAARIPSRQ
ncbi:DUF6417 family protein [Streptomyces sp. NPDC014864]|uniref:DUF6417 family protein n=1 Tax=Streptomyces sp. NPDC014864 TaxID=3364924 RepID=UPI0036FD265F